MARTVLLVIEMLLIVVALGGGATVLYRSREAWAGSAGLTGGKVQVLADLLLTGVVLFVMGLAAWAVYVERSWARWMSIIAGAVLVAVLALRPGLAGHQWMASLLGLSGVLVAVLGFLLPGGT